MGNRMSLDTSKLETVRELPGGIVQARCPACAEGGHDRTGEHLRIYPDGRFGCCVHPKDKEHRKRIFALAGCKLHLPSSGAFIVRIKAPSVASSSLSVKAALTAFKSGTLGTGNSELRARARVDSTTAHIDIGADFQEKLKDLETGVPSVPTAVVAGPLSAAGQRLPYLTPGGSLVIPFDSPERYHWWKPDGERLSVAETLREVKERMKHAVTV